MNRRDWLKHASAFGLGTTLVGASGVHELLGQQAECVLIPQETEGPYPLDLSRDATKFRQDITEGKPGVPLHLMMTIVNVNNGCRPIPNARVDIWHTDKDGVYSGYNQPGANTVGQTFMRGIQITDSNGRVRFTTIYPGWYTGRVTHIHFQVFVTSILRATSQLAFPDAVTAAVYRTPLYAARGQNTSVPSNAADSIFRDGFQHQLLTITENPTTGGYDASITVGIQAPLTGITELEPETGGQFVLQQNYPNPFAASTTFSFTLKYTAFVELSIYDMNGRKLVVILSRTLHTGEHTVHFDRALHGLAPGNYLFELRTKNAAGEFHQCKVMTVW
ncbi:MAG: T9SS type A sorting domain-containing protein [Bacteroidota bacterium]|nr:T9SS type A sorting domain-containing protein [Candidatus Kapabacteria bacterium]MDW8220105.1 T9SS type A sorting domain-containing protein [Bacteroidota bacterium]